MAIFRSRSVSSRTGFNGSKGSFALKLSLGLLHFITLILAITVCGLYGQDLNNAHKAHVYSDPKWAFAVVVGAFSAVTSVAYMVPIDLWRWFFPWDFILFFLWIVVFGIFGNMYIKTDAQGDGGIERMKHAVWVDLVNMLLWLGVAVLHLVIWFRHRQNKTLWTGRATV
jgi:hypothetical protein